MTKQQKIDTLIKKLGRTKTSRNLFNPFKDTCSIHDKKEAPEIRRYNLKLLLDTHLSLKTNVVWVFEAPSYLGARRSGAPFVNEGMFRKVESLLKVIGNFRKATFSQARTAMTSRIAWRTAQELGIRPLILESIPFHPYLKENPMSNRKPTKSEISEYKEFLLAMLEIFNPKLIISAGRVAEDALKVAGIKSIYVRHPANGGARKFREQISQTLELSF